MCPECMDMLVLGMNRKTQDGMMSYLHSADVHVFLCVEQGAMNKADAKFTKKWNDHFSHSVNTAIGR